MSFLIGLLLIAIGILIIRYRYQIHGFTGEWWWAQKYLGGNGTIVAIALSWALCIFIGVAYPLGAFKNSEVVPSETPTTSVFGNR